MLYVCPLGTGLSMRLNIQLVNTHYSYGHVHNSACDLTVTQGGLSCVR